jgi:hypothetical protein
MRYVPFPSIIDSSMYATWKGCPQKMWKMYFNHWKPKGESVHLVAGKAYASGLEAARRAFFEDGKSEEDAQALGLTALVREYGDFECPPESNKSLGRTMGALEYYLSQYPLASEEAKPLELPEGKRAIEMSFSEPIDVRHPETGDPLIYVGRADQIVTYAGALYGEDDKTTSSLGFGWGEKWHLRSQFTSYCWGFRKIGFELGGFLVRGISILKTKYETQQIPTPRPQWVVDRWYTQMVRDLQVMTRQWGAAMDGDPSYFHYNLDETCTTYGKCAFYNVCRSKDEAPWLKQDFERKIWDPVNRTEIILPPDRKVKVLITAEAEIPHDMELASFQALVQGTPNEALKDYAPRGFDTEVAESELSTVIQAPAELDYPDVPVKELLFKP